MNYTTQHSNGYSIINIGNQLSMLSSIEFLKDVIEDCLKKGENRIAVRFQNSSFLSSHSITILINCNELVKSNGGDFLIVGGGEELEHYLDTLGIRERFSLCIAPHEFLNHL